MQKIIPFKKDIMFKTNLSEITSVSLEHQFGINDNVVTGSFNISGQYKMNDTSDNIEDFNFDLPFDINMDSKYDISNATVDIDDFYYEVINNNCLRINIDVLVNDIEEMENIEEEEKEIIEEERCIEEENNVLESIFDNLDSSNEIYKSYRVYIVRDGDTIDSIIDKYQITKEDLEKYNNLKDIKLNDKLIIPTND